MTLKKWLDNRQQELLDELLEIRERYDGSSLPPHIIEVREVEVVSKLDIINEIKSICNDRGRY